MGMDHRRRLRSPRQRNAMTRQHRLGAIERQAVDELGGDQMGQQPR